MIYPRGDEVPRQGGSAGMSELEGVMHYVAGLGAEVGAEKTPAGTLPFVTISRQAGAGGHTLGKALIRRMAAEKGAPLFKGWQLFDNEICERILEDKKIKVTLSSLLSEQFHTATQDWLHQLVAGTSSQAKVDGKVFETIRTVAGIGKAIIVGRSARHVTRAYAHGVHVRLVASRESRERWMADAFALERSEAAKRVKEQDGFRARRVRELFKADIESPLLYDAVFNTDAVPIDVIAESMMAMIREQARHGKPSKN